MLQPEPVILSVIIPTKNRPHLLKRALQSVIVQNYSFFEICIVDNNTDAAIRQQVKNIFDELKLQRPELKWLYIHSAKPYASGARNDGIAATSGKYIVFLDDDDELLANSLLIRAQIMQADAQLALLYCAGMSLIYPYGVNMYRYYKYNKRLHTDRLMMMSCSSIMINREVFEANNLSFYEDLSRMEDYDLCRELIRLDLKIKSIPQALVQIHLHPDTRLSSRKLTDYTFKKILVERWGPSAEEEVYSYAEGVHIWRKCFGMQDLSYTEIVAQLKADFNRTPTRGFKLRYRLVSLSPHVYLALYHACVFLSQQYKNRKT